MSFIESLETLFPWRGMVVEITLSFLKAVSWVIQLKGVTFSCCVVSGNKGTETQVVLLAALGYSQGVHLVISAVGTKELLVMQDSVVNSNLQGQQVKPLCEPSCLCGVWGQLGAAHTCPGGQPAPQLTPRAPLLV